MFIAVVYHSPIVTYRQVGCLLMITLILATKNIIVNSNVQMSIDSKEALRMATEIVDKNELDDVKTRIADMIIELNQLKEELDGAHPAIERLRTLVNQLKGENEILLDEVEILKNAKNMLAATVARLKRPV